MSDGGARLGEPTLVVPLDDADAPRSVRIGVRASVAVDAIERIVAIALEDPEDRVLLDADGALGLIQRIADTRRWELRDGGPSGRA